MDFKVSTFMFFIRFSIMTLIKGDAGNAETNGVYPVQDPTTKEVNTAQELKGKLITKDQ